MSAYGDIQTATSNVVLRPTTWSTKNGHYLTVHHVKRSLLGPGLLNYLNATFAKVVEEGRTYPQEGEMGQETFLKYFFAGDVFLAIIGTSGANEPTPLETCGGEWEKYVAGFYYVKPNYPGRSSHICNAGFVVPAMHQGAGYGFALAQSYLHYAPRLGYKASVFNLVYVNNIASVKLWERLGFVKAGRIPRAGRLRTKDGEDEEYVDAWVFYKEFEKAA